MDPCPDLRPGDWRPIADLFQPTEAVASHKLCLVRREWIQGVRSPSRPSRSLTQERTKCAKWHACHVYEAIALQHAVFQSAETRSSGLSNAPGGPPTHARAVMEPREAANVSWQHQHVPIRPRRAKSVAGNVDVMSKGGIAV